jgi:hypothetical protein
MIGFWTLRFKAAIHPPFFDYRRMKDVRAEVGLVVGASRTIARSAIDEIVEDIMGYEFDVTGTGNLSLGAPACQQKHRE